MPIWHPEFSSEANGGRGYVRFRATELTLDGRIDAVAVVNGSVWGDATADDRVDLADFTCLHVCFTGPGGAGGPLEPIGDCDCQKADTDGDGRVDAWDFFRLVLNFTGSW